MHHAFVAVDPLSPVVVQNAPYICSGGNIQLSTQYAQTYLWLPDSIISPTLQITHGGDYSVQVNYHQCISTSPVLNVIEHPSPVVNLGADTSYCQTTVFTLHAPQGYQTYLWQNGSTSPDFYTNLGGLYYVTVSSAYCSTTDSINLGLITCNLALANFNASQTSICENSCINFNDLSSFADSWQWHFPGSNTPVSYDQHPSNICYSAPGTYDVELIVTNEYGANAITLSNFITVNAGPTQPDIIVNGYWLSSSIGAASYQWYLNGNSIPGATHQSYYANSDGFYHVEIENASGCTTSSTEAYLSVTVIAGIDAENSISIYPNPVRDQFTIADRGIDIQNLLLVDPSGKNVYLQANKNGQNELTVNTADLENGIYFLMIISENKSISKKIVVQH
jgi:hypothetical protein